MNFPFCKSTNLRIEIISSQTKYLEYFWEVIFVSKIGVEYALAPDSLVGRKSFSLLIFAFW
jgi:hypothetical protein